jgi:hypothetical protein
MSAIDHVHPVQFAGVTPAHTIITGTIPGQSMAQHDKGTSSAGPSHLSLSEGETYEANNSRHPDIRGEHRPYRWHAAVVTSGPDKTARTRKANGL